MLTAAGGSAIDGLSAEKEKTTNIKILSVTRI
jgi:hypothetical protein